jgi:hypothetical protein
MAESAETSGGELQADERKSVHATTAINGKRTIVFMNSKP